jgi:hypothetical protein
VDDGFSHLHPDAVGGLDGNLLANDGPRQRLKTLAAQLHSFAPIRANDGS